LHSFSWLCCIDYRLESTTSRIRWRLRFIGRTTRRRASCRDLSSQVELCMAVGNPMGMAFPLKYHGNGSNHIAYNGNGMGMRTKQWKWELHIFCVCKNSQNDCRQYAASVATPYFSLFLNSQYFF